MNQISYQPKGLGFDPSLADLRASILTDVTLAQPRRTAIASALNTVSRVLNQPLEALPADPPRLRPLLSGITPAIARLSPGSWRNAVSLLQAGLNHLHGDLLPRRMDLPPSPLWIQCLRATDTASRSRYFLARLARYATRLGIEPEDVDDALLARYTADLIERSLTAEPGRVARDTARAWNEAAERYPDWPQSHLTIPDNRVRYSLAWEAYPISLQKEVALWLDWMGRDPFADRDFRPLRPASIAARHRQLALYLGALVEAGDEPSGMTSFAAVTTLASAKRALLVLYRRGGEKPSTHLAQMADLALLLARHWVKLGEAEVQGLRRLARQLRPVSTGLTERNEARLGQLNDNRRMEAVLTLPVVLSAQVRKAGPPTVLLARQFQTAVAVEIFLMTALRISNVAALEIGRSLLLRDDGGVDLHIPRGEVKNDTHIAADLPAESAALIGRYIKFYRPLLGDPNSRWLFPGTKPGTHKTIGGLRDQVTNAMSRRCGVNWHPHLFRHLLARLLLEQNAGADGVVTRALGHKRAETAREHYIGYQTKAAIRHHDELLLRRRAAILGNRKGGKS